MVKFMWNGIKVDGELYKSHYSKGRYTFESGIPQESITIYGKHYCSFPLIEGLQIENDSDSMTDYFENDRILVTPDNIHYPAVLEAYRKQTEHQEKRFAKKYGNSSKRV